MRKPIKNTNFIKKYYKLSTLKRLEDFGYKTHIDINSCPIITEWLDKCFEEENSKYKQDDLFEFLISFQKGKNE